uniref:Eyes absent homolog n=1 Tax=Rhabditophanes sp. KR3021 TaxID=114890 RepID=A0AC35UAX0_9BILA
MTFSTNQTLTTNNLATSGVWSVLDPTSLTLNSGLIKSEGDNLNSLTMPLISTSQSSNTLMSMQDAVNGYDSRMLNPQSYYNSSYSNAAAYNNYNSTFNAAYNTVSSSNLTSTAPFPNYFMPNGQSYYPVAGTYTNPLNYGSYASAAAGVQAQYYNSRNPYYNTANLNSVSPTSLTSYAGLTSAMMDNAAVAVAMNGSMTPNSSGQISPFTASLKSNSSSAESKKNKVSKKKKGSGGGNCQEVNYTRIFIWELDDIFCLSRFARENNAAGCLSIQSTMNQIVNSAFRIEHAEDCDQMNIEDTNYDETIQDLGYQSNDSANQTTSTPLSSNASRNGVEWVRKLSARYQHIKEVYNQYKNNFDDIVENNNGMHMRSKEICDILQNCNPGANNWIERIRVCLKAISENPGGHFTNIVITSDTLSNSLAKMLLINIANFVPIENVYSIGKTTKDAAIDRIVTKFGKKQSFFMVSSNESTLELSKKENIPIWKIAELANIEAFHIALTQFLL